MLNHCNTVWLKKSCDATPFMDPCPYLVKYSPDILKKKTKVLDIFNADKKCFIKINKESSPQKLWKRTFFCC